MIKAIIIDDEPNCITALQDDIKLFCPEVEIVATCNSGKEGMRTVQRANPDLVFLDVEMPWMNGFEMLELLGNNFQFQVIFTTAYDHFAARAFRVSAVDYLLKPVDSGDLINAIDKVKKALGSKQGLDNVNNLLLNVKSVAAEQKIAVASRNGYEFIPVNEILYCKADGSYTTMILAGNKKLMLSKSLGEAEQLLPAEMFERAHHSALVNIHHVNHFMKTNGCYLIMKNGDEVNVAKSKRDHLMMRLGIS